MTYREKSIARVFLIIGVVLGGVIAATGIALVEVI